ncbi:MAG: bifunctional riboflavin kinase/FAD synthetase [Beijerinckiaceae bacterium]
MSQPLQIIRDPQEPPATLGRPVIAIGNFDGMHLGHQALAAAALRSAARIGARAALLTFDPHPRAYFRPGEPIFLLSPPPMKARLAARAGLDALLTLSFDAALASLPAEAFVASVLVKRLNVAGVIVGHDFHFGAGRGGSPEFLRAAGDRHGFAVEVVAPVALGDRPVSSSAIRDALEAGDVGFANAMLGHAWSVLEEVRHGDKRGRELGYPTANLHLDPATHLRHGIYAVEAIIDGVHRPAVASFGRRPTFDGGAPKLEVHVFDFDGDLYGREIEVAFHGFLRPEEKFDSLDALISQMDQDSVGARRILAAV